MATLHSVRSRHKSISQYIAHSCPHVRAGLGPSGLMHPSRRMRFNVQPAVTCLKHRKNWTFLENEQSGVRDAV